MPVAIITQIIRFFYIENAINTFNFTIYEKYVIFYGIF